MRAVFGALQMRWGQSVDIRDSSPHPANATRAALGGEELQSHPAPAWCVAYLSYEVTKEGAK
jgi:hypothetical protein